MAQKVTAMDIRIATALVGQIDNVSQFCRIGRSVGRRFTVPGQFGADGLAGLQERHGGQILHPPRPHRSKKGLRQRKQLLEQGLDHGPQSIVWTLAARRDSGAVALDGVADLTPTG